MARRSHPVLMTLMLLAIALRSAFGAPCCMDMAAANNHEVHAAHSDHAHHDDQASDQHSGHGDDPSAQPCCSACGPTLPPDPVLIAQRDAPRTLTEPSEIRALATRPPYPAYEATGPPLLV